MEAQLTALEAVTDDISTYLASRLWHKLFDFPNDYPAESLSQGLVTHCERAIAVIAEAWTNPPIVVNWDIDDYIGAIGKQPTGTCILVETAIASKFPPAFPEHIDVVEGNPTRVNDRMGHILAWYLPGIMSEELQAQVRAAAKILHPLLQVPDKSNGTWRSDPRYYRNICFCKYPLGIVNLVPLWYQAGHGHDGSPLQASASLKEDNGAGEQFLWQVIEFQAIIGGIMSVIHPEQHYGGRGALLRCLRPQSSVTLDKDCLQRIMKVWGTAFTGLSVISERETPLHRDGQNADWMYDLLVNLSSHVDPDLQVELPGIGIRFRYGSGTVLSILGKVVRHGVSRTDTDRYCLAFFMRERVSERLGGVPHVVMMSEEVFKKWLSLDEPDRVKAMLRIQGSGFLLPLEC
ncbi:uncharacterized protein LACBIDRAFT_298012 [Laccaria bicolor S238N-H82]|uniref:Predicted protein n=1 Tax=Laccaria bicolor (strain S238N-H82 / ATCC MYA-4686) TaxID=486041 RepID=B0DC25_LACBS|nr:uncharacterized protein LACBIDRAFT_298012 [Laccaria bicolor S238N-H82]EDR07661.1 predicted protein [Laccaria bicolor S238N-H82]|eukprot:XP_001881450.1 predicted protein [Laccaria bicolor S238N-H82]